MRACLGRLEAAGLIRPCDAAVVAVRIKRADRRPRGWDLDLSLIRDDLAEEDVAALERQFPGLAARLAAAPGPGHDFYGVQSPHPARAVDNRASGVQPLHPAPGTGCHQRTNGVQSVQPRGAVVAPEPYKEPSREPAAAREAPHAADAAGGGPIGEFFAALGPNWQLTSAQRARLAPAVQAAFHAGWMPQALVAVAGANTTGVRSPYAVLAARLSPAELPPPHGQRPIRPQWCGQCDEVTRMLGFDGDAPRPCPRCKRARADAGCQLEQARAGTARERDERHAELDRQPADAEREPDGLRAVFEARATAIEEARADLRDRADRADALRAELARVGARTGAVAPGPPAGEESAPHRRPGAAPPAGTASRFRSHQDGAQGYPAVISS